MTNSGAEEIVFDIEIVVRRASILYEQGHLEAARQVILDVVKVRPNHVEALVTFANILREMGYFKEALAPLERAINHKPDHIRARAALALTYFYQEDWARAWRAFDIRFDLLGHKPFVNFPENGGAMVQRPPWREGAAPPSILVLAEQGLGDTIQFVRFLPFLADAGSNVTCLIQEPLIPFVQTVDDRITFLPLGHSGRVQGVSAWTPIMHLPQALKIGPDAFARRIPYLRAESEAVNRRRAQIGTDEFKVGLVWRGNPDPRIDRGRSAPLSAFRALADIPGIRLISLQKGKGEEEAFSVEFAERVETPAADIDLATDGFRETAAIIECLDLVVTVDTSVAHVAGALGKPVIILLKRIGSDWRWLYGRNDSIWYPTVQLFRQSMPDAWEELLNRVAVEVTKRAAEYKKSFTRLGN